MSRVPFFPALSVFLAATAAAPAFAALSQPVALAKMVEDADRYGARAAYVFDLDETTVDSSPRRYEALLDAIDEACARTATPHPDCEALRFIKLADLYRLRNRYDDLAYLRHYGAKDEAFIAAISKRSLEVYLSGRYIADKDHLFVGVQSFIKALKRSGAKIFFVSSRSVERQGRATLRFLEERGLLRPGEADGLYLKPDAEPSADFKSRATRAIAVRVADAGGRVFGIFENEPENLEIWIRNFPRAIAFFMTGAYIKEGPVATKAVILRDFRF